jgi:transcriptional regulator with XRE-family HTH domain
VSRTSCEIPLQVRPNTDTILEVTGVLNREAARIRDATGLSDADVARATGAAQSTARAWLNGTRAPTGDRAERLIELSALVERLERLMEPDYIAVWLRKPVPALDDEKPIDLLGRGDYLRVARLISELESPTAV